MPRNIVIPSTDPQGCPTVHPGTVPAWREGNVVVVVVTMDELVVVGTIVVAVMMVVVDGILVVSTPSHELHETITTVAASKRAEDRRMPTSVRRPAWEGCRPNRRWS